MKINADLFGILALHDHVFNGGQTIISWKPPTKPSFKLNLEACQSEDRT